MLQFHLTNLQLQITQENNFPQFDTLLIINIIWSLVCIYVYVFGLLYLKKKKKLIEKIATEGICASYKDIPNYIIKA